MKAPSPSLPPHPLLRALKWSDKPLAHYDVEFFLIFFFSYVIISRSTNIILTHYNITTVRFRNRTNHFPAFCTYLRVRCRVLQINDFYFHYYYRGYFFFFFIVTNPLTIYRHKFQHEYGTTDRTNINKSLTTI